MRRIVAALAPVVLLLSGCGYIGDPLPPLANVPNHPTDTFAVQRASRLIMSFKLPTETTEGMAIRGPLQTDLRIGTAGTGAFSEPEWAAHAKDIGEGAVTDGVAHYDIPSAEWTGVTVTIAARVIGANGKASGWSNFVNLAVVPTPAPPGSLKAGPTPAGVRLTWTGAPGAFRILRRADNEKNFTGIAEVQQLEWTDPASEFGQHYTYRVQRIIKSGERVEAESEPSEVSITPKDIFPPAVPAGLEAVAAPASIELSWQADTEPDLAGYRVYRAAPGGQFEKIADVSVPAYSDQKVERGKTYRYAVTAVDRAGNESARSAVVEATL